MQCHQRQVDFTEVFRHSKQVSCEKDSLCCMSQMLLADMNKLVHLPWWFRATWILVPLFVRTESVLTLQSIIPSLWKYLSCFEEWFHNASMRFVVRTALSPLSWEKRNCSCCCALTGTMAPGGDSSLFLSPSQTQHMQVNAMLCVEQCHLLLSPLLWPRSINFF